MQSSASGVCSHSTEHQAEPVRVPALARRFRDPQLLWRALTHRSRGRDNNERLEFLGDAVLSLVVAELLCHAYPDVDEGDLSRMRSRLVRESTLAEIARELELGDHLRLGSGELKSGGFLRSSILADALEAVIGAVYLDRGYPAARDLIEDLMQERIADLPDPVELKDPKTRLQEVLQGLGRGLPEYLVVDQSGADHARRFKVACRVPGPDGVPSEFVATQGSRRRAEQTAARQALAMLELERTS